MGHGPRAFGAPVHLKHFPLMIRVHARGGGGGTKYIIQTPTLKYKVSKARKKYVERKEKGTMMNKEG